MTELKAFYNLYCSTKTKHLTRKMGVAHALQDCINAYVVLSLSADK